MYVIWTILPTYDYRDAIVGSRAVRANTNVYMTLRCPMKIAQRMSEENYQDGGDNSFVVRPVGMSPFDIGPHPFFAQLAQEERWGGAVAIDDEIPF